MTEDQMSLYELHELVLPQHEQQATLEERFTAFDEANPWVYEAMVKLTAGYVANGARRVSAKMLMEVVRYTYGATRGDDRWKLNNNLTALYARKIVREHPEWDGFFELRTRRSEQAAA